MTTRRRSTPTFTLKSAKWLTGFEEVVRIVGLDRLREITEASEFLKCLRKYSTLVKQVQAAGGLREALKGVSYQEWLEELGPEEMARRILPNGTPEQQAALKAILESDD